MKGAASPTTATAVPVSSDPLAGLGGLWGILGQGLVRLIDTGSRVLDEAFLGDEERYLADQQTDLERERINAETEQARIAAQAQRDLILGGVFVLVAGALIFVLAKGANNG